eukprot:scaffold384617_cov166-Cyclotella_meneghiniana.AAC.1
MLSSGSIIQLRARTAPRAKLALYMPYQLFQLSPCDKIVRGRPLESFMPPWSKDPHIPSAPPKNDSQPEAVKDIPQSLAYTD